MMGGRSKMPSRETIANRWMENAPFDFGFAGGHMGLKDDELVPDECWACGDVLILERCHIVSVADGGGNDPINLTILCKACHIESEAIKPERFANWLRFKRQNEWIYPWMHSRNRIRKHGYTDDVLIRLLENSTPEVAAQKILQEIYGEA